MVCIGKQTNEHTKNIEFPSGKAALEKEGSQIGKNLELEPPTPIDENIYSGCGRSNQKHITYKKHVANDVTGLFKQNTSPVVSDNGTTICTARGERRSQSSTSLAETDESLSKTK